MTYSKISKNVETSEEIDCEDQKESNAALKLNNKKRKAENANLIQKKKGKMKQDETIQDFNQLRETENLFHSNLFRLQIEEIINATKIKNKYKNLFETWFQKFTTQIKIANENEDLELEDHDKFFEIHNFKIPMEKLSNDCKGTFKYVPPSNIEIGGSYSLDTIIGPEASIDILVEMPEVLFQKVDCKNYRYMRKKAIYLAYLGTKIKEDLAENKRFTGNHLNPVLKIVPNGALSKKFVIYIHLVVQETAFLINKFTPEKNNVKRSWYFNEKDISNHVNPPTPHYNSIALFDLTALKSNNKNIKIIKEYPNVRDGIVLLKIWLKQRVSNKNFDSFNSHILTNYVIYMVLTKKINRLMSSYQIVRITLQNLANSNWCKEGISLCQEENTSGQINNYHKFYDCVFLDHSGVCNLASNILEDSFKWISDQAKISIECLNNTQINGFQILFMQKVRFYEAFDNIICFHNVKALENIIIANSSDADLLNYGPNKYIQGTKLISKILKQGLGNRVSMVYVLPRKLRDWDVDSEIPNDVENIYVGLQFNSSTYSNIIEKGPSANLKEAESFRRFWGHKSELRRFKDGTICETVVWAKENSTLSQKREIPQRISKYLLEQKLKLFEKIHYCFFSNQVEEFLKLKKIKVTKFKYGPEEAALQILNVFSNLEKDLTNLNDLPLSISGVQGCSPLFRYAEVFPPLSSVHVPDEVNVVDGKTHHLFPTDLNVEEVPTYVAPIEAVLQLSTSGKWPDDLEALRMTKAAFHIQIADNLRDQKNLRVHASQQHIDIMKEGLVFRFRIAHQKEIGLVKQQVGEDGVIKYRDNEESMELEKNLFHLPRLTGALYGLHCQQSTFGPACCLAKRWLSAQLIDDYHMPVMGVELILASVYLNPGPYQPAETPQVAFLRFLEFFVNENWSTEPIIVNFNNQMTHEEIVEVENLFGSSRDTLPPLFISTPYDKQTSAWTRKAPNLLILNRISSLAREALKLVENQLMNCRILFDPLFSPPLSEYDCVIGLNKSFISRRLEAIASTDSNFSPISSHPFKEHPKMKIPIVAFDPVAEYLKELRSNYNDYAFFFHDTYGGSLIGVLLKPNVLTEKSFKVSNISCQKLINDQLILNVSAMIEDFYILGKDLVKTINIQSKKINRV